MWFGTLAAPVHIKNKRYKGLEECPLEAVHGRQLGLLRLEHTAARLATKFGCRTDVVEVEATVKSLVEGEHKRLMSSITWGYNHSNSRRRKITSHRAQDRVQTLDFGDAWQN